MRSLMRMSQRGSPSRPLPPTPTPTRRALKPSQPLLNVLPGYTALVMDTNILMCVGVLTGIASGIEPTGLIRDDR